MRLFIMEMDNMVMFSFKTAHFLRTLDFFVLHDSL